MTTQGRSYNLGHDDYCKDAVVISAVIWNNDRYIIVIIAAVKEDQRTVMHRELIESPNLTLEEVNEIRDGFVASLKKRFVAVIEPATEKEMLEACERLWPGREVAQLRDDIEKERASPTTNVFTVGSYKCELTFTPPNDLQVKWDPHLPTELTESELAQYHAGRNALLAEVAEQGDGDVVVIE